MPRIKKSDILYLISLCKYPWVLHHLLVCLFIKTNFKSWWVILQIHWEITRYRKHIGHNRDNNLNSHWNDKLTSNTPLTPKRHHFGRKRKVAAMMDSFPYQSKKNPADSNIENQTKPHFFSIVWWWDNLLEFTDEEGLRKIEWRFKSCITSQKRPNMNTLVLVSSNEEKTS